MNHDLIRQWLDLPAGKWPPDHYTLLTLPPKEADGDLIERRVHERMNTVRPYQLSLPEEVTEVLNRLATAYNCLTDPAAKQDYDASLDAYVVAERSGRPAGFALDPADPLAWLFGPWSQSTIPASPDRPKIAADPGPLILPLSGEASVSDTDQNHAKEQGRVSPVPVGKIWPWIRERPGIPLLIFGLLAFLVAMIRHWKQ